MNKKTIELSKFEDEILDLIDDAPQLTTSDLQGIVAVIVSKIYKAGKYEAGKKGGEI